MKRHQTFSLPYGTHNLARFTPGRDMALIADGGSEQHATLSRQPVQTWPWPKKREKRGGKKDYWQQPRGHMHTTIRKADPRGKQQWCRSCRPRWLSIHWVRLFGWERGGLGGVFSCDVLLGWCFLFFLVPESSSTHLFYDFCCCTYYSLLCSNPSALSLGVKVWKQ